jgi:hypothetical protein
MTDSQRSWAGYIGGFIIFGFLAVLVILAFGFVRSLMNHPIHEIRYPEKTIVL